MATGNKMRPTALIVGILLTLFAPFGADARDAYASWDNRCEECHGDADEFARKYLWVVGDQLQGRHHVDDLRLFMRNHYIPAHEIDKMHAMLRKQANDLGRFAVPHLLDLAEEDPDAAVRRMALRVLGENAQRQMQHRYGRRATEDEKEHNRQVQAENTRLRELIPTRGIELDPTDPGADATKAKALWELVERLR